MQKKTPIANPNLKDFWTKPSRYKVLYGGRASSKSWDAAIRALYLAQKTKLKFLCTRKFQNRIEESVYSLLKDQINRLGYQREFTVLNNKIIHNVTGSEFLFYGLARNIQEIKSLEGVDILWNEESHSINKDDFEEILEPTIRKDHSEVWFIFNPDLKTDYVYDRFVLNTPENAIVRKINYDENQFVSDTILKIINNLKERDYEAYEHIYLGYPKENDEQSIIKKQWIDAAVDAHKKLGIEPTGTKRLGYDVADAGDDSNAIVNRYGILVDYMDQWNASEDELMKSSKIAYNKAKEKQAMIIYDSVGVGAGCGSKFNEINQDMQYKVDYHPFNAGGKVQDPDKEYKYGVKNKDQFSNVKAQAWTKVADLLLNTYNAVKKGESFKEDEIISISSECNYIEALKTELSSPKKEFDSSSRIKVESKKDMKKRGVPSPNIADAFIMAFAPVHIKDLSAMFEDEVEGRERVF